MAAARKLQVLVHKATHTTTDTITVTAEVIGSWKAPPFQRLLKINEKVRMLAERMKADGGVIPGVITLGKLGRDTYLLDGQHRIQAFLITELTQGFADVRIHEFEDMGAMGEEFVALNSKLVSLKPDDILRGLEESMPPLRYIRQHCPFVGYDFIRRGPSNGIVSMSTTLRCWYGASQETPQATGVSVAHLATTLTLQDAESLCAALSILEMAWGRDREYMRMWTTINLGLCLWLWRRLVDPGPPDKGTRVTRFTKDAFRKCMMSVSADGRYYDWLLGRHLAERDRSPAMAKLKTIIGRRYYTDHGKRPILPAPAWQRGHERIMRSRTEP